MLPQIFDSNILRPICGFFFNVKVQITKCGNPHIFFSVNL